MRRGVVVGAVLLGAVGLAGGTWVVAGQVMRSPAEITAATAAPEPSLVTAPVDERVLVANLIVRGTVRFEEPLVVRLRGAPAVDGEPVATHLPEVGDSVDSGDVLLQVSGRPVFLLEGRLPAYRDLRPGSTGDDVEQLQVALTELGYDTAGTDGVFGPGTQDAVRALYENAGHSAPGPTAEEEERLTMARDRRFAAGEELAAAEQMLADAGQGPPRAELLQAEASVNEARDAVAAAEDDTSRRRARDQLAVAEAHLADLRAAPDTSAESRMVSAARELLAAAEQEVAELQASIGVWLPAGEVAYLAALPQRVDDVAVGVGDVATGDLVTMTSPEIVIESSVPAADVDLVAVGGDALIDDESGGEIAGTIIEVAEDPDGGGSDARHAIIIEPEGDVGDLVGASLRVVLPVSSTDGPVLTVPIAALSARADGSSVVEVVDDASGESRLVVVEPGLTADGHVEVTVVGGELRDGDQVVVAGGDAAPPTDGPTQDAPDDVDVEPDDVDEEPSSAPVPSAASPRPGGGR